MNRTDLARRSLRAAIEFRASRNIAEDVPICIYDVAESAGLDVRFCLGDSFEGMFSKATSTILVPTSRPRGRQTFACAHELGHWHFGHGSRLEAMLERPQVSQDSEEFLADVFAGFILMPPWAIKRALTRRGLLAKSITPKDLYTLAGQFGVGYKTLADHLCFSLKFVTRGHRDKLLKYDPKHIRDEILGPLALACRHSPIVDMAWECVPIDLHVGDLAILPPQSSPEGLNIETVADNEFGRIIKGIKPGIGRAELPGSDWSAFIRVSKADFSGRAAYRHLEDPDVN
jgi:Zn-dependent peptidase ImmA (M78 family)